MKVEEQSVDLSTVLSEDEAERVKELEADFKAETSLKSVGQEEEKKPEEKAAVEEKKPTEEEKKPEVKEEPAAEPKPVLEEKKEEPKVDFEKQLRERDELLTTKDAKIRELESRVKSDEIRKQREVKIVEADKLYGQFVEQRSLVTMKAIDAISEEDPDYDKKIASIRAKEASDIKVYERQHPELVGIFYDEPPKPMEQEKIGKPAQAIGSKPIEKQEVAPPSDEEKQLREFVSSAAGKAGLDPKDATFTYFCNKAPSKLEDGTPMPFEDQVVWAIERTKNYQLFVQTEATEKGKERQKKNLPLGRGTGDLPKGKEKEYRPVSIDDALIQVRQERTL